MTASEKLELAQKRAEKAELAYTAISIVIAGFLIWELTRKNS